MSVVPARHGHLVPPDFPAPVRALAWLSRGLAFLEGVGIGVALAALLVLALWQSIARTLHMGLLPAIPPAPEWTGNVLRHAVFVIGFGGAMFAAYTARHLRIDAVTRLVGVRGRLGLRICATLGAIAVCLAIGGWGWVFRVGVLDEPADPGQVFTASRGALVLVAGAGCMVFHLLVQVAIDATWLASARPVPDWWIAEAPHGGEDAIAGPAGDRAG